MIIRKNKCMIFVNQIIFPSFRNMDHFQISKIRYEFKYFVRVIFVVVGLGITIWQLNHNVHMFMKNHTKTEVTVESNTLTPFPSVTICLNSMHSLGIISMSESTTIQFLFFYRSPFKSCSGRCFFVHV